MFIQVLDCIKILQTKSTLPIQRSRMRVRITMPSKDGKRLKETILESAEKVEENEFGQNDWELVCNVFQVLCFHFMAQLRMNICPSDILGHAHRSWSVQSLDRAVEQRSQGTRED